MPILATLIASFFSALSAFVANLLISKVAVRIAAVAAIAVLGTGLLFLFNFTLAPLASGIFQTQYGQLLGLVFPPIAGTCVAAIITLYMACLTYRLQVQAIKVTANI